jgi:hypothetical protein
LRTVPTALVTSRGWRCGSGSDASSLASGCQELVALVEEDRGFRLVVVVLPLEVPVHRHQAPAFRRGRLEGRLLDEGLGAGVDHPGPDLGILRPRGDQAPLDAAQLAHRRGVGLIAQRAFEHALDDHLVVVVAAQRAQVQVARELILTTVGDDLARRVRLAVLDRCWSEHLALLADLRETIHLRAMARMNPWLSFNTDAEQHFGTLLADAEDEASRLLAQHPHARDLQDVGLHRPSSTWTYVLSDLHFGNDLDRAARSVQRALRRRQRT